jgi:hypothetical protein
VARKKNIAFPLPIKTEEGKYARNFYRYADVVHYLDAVIGNPPRELSGNDLIKIITERTFRDLLGGVSKMYLYRRTRLPSVAEAAV